MPHSDVTQSTYFEMVNISKNSFLDLVQRVAFKHAYCKQTCIFFIEQSLWTAQYQKYRTSDFF